MSFQAPQCAQDALAGARQREHAQVHGGLAHVLEAVGNAPVDDGNARAGDARLSRKQDGGGEADGPGADDHDVVVIRHGGHSSGRPRASRGMRPANPQLTRDSARLAVGLRSNSSSPKLRTRPKPGRSLPNSFTRLSVKRVTPRRSSSRQAAKRV